jgi:hypothetical protein
MSDKAQEVAKELMKSGKVASAVVSDGKVLVKNQISGNWEPYTGQQVQDPRGNYAGKRGKE